MYVLHFDTRKMHFMKPLFLLVPLIFTLCTVVQSDLDFVCYPNLTVSVSNPNPGVYTHLFAVQDEGIASAVICTVTPDGSGFLIDDCNAAEKDINVFLSNRTALAGINNFGGIGIISYTIGCDVLPTVGVYRTVVNPLGATLEKTTQAQPATPTYDTWMDFRPIGSLGSVTSTSIVGRFLYWTIDFPAEYFARPKICRAYAGTDNTGSPSIDLIIDGCSQDTSLVFADFYYYPDNWYLPSPLIKRLITTFFTFKFYNTDLLYFECILKLCPEEANCEIDCDGEKKRSIADADNMTEAGVTITKTGKLFRIVPEPENSARVFKGGLWILMAVYVALY